MIPTIRILRLHEDIKMIPTIRILRLHEIPTIRIHKDI